MIYPRPLFPYGIPAVPSDYVRRRDFEGLDPIPERFTDEDVRRHHNELLDRLSHGRVLARVLAVLSLVSTAFGGAVEFESKRKGDVYNDERIVVGLVDNGMSADEIRAYVATNSPGMDPSVVTGIVTSVAYTKAEVDSALGATNDFRRADEPIGFSSLSADVIGSFTSVSNTASAAVPRTEFVSAMESTNDFRRLGVEIGRSELSAGVRTSLALADTALQPSALTNYYDRPEVDALIEAATPGGYAEISNLAVTALQPSALTNYYDRTEVDALVEAATPGGYAEISNLAVTALQPDALTNYYDRSEVDALVEAATPGGYAEISNLAVTALQPDALTNYYDRTETDGLLAEKRDLTNLVVSAEGRTEPANEHWTWTPGENCPQEFLDLMKTASAPRPVYHDTGTNGVWGGVVLTWPDGRARYMCTLKEGTESDVSVTFRMSVIGEDGTSETDIFLATATRPSATDVTPVPTGRDDVLALASDLAGKTGSWEFNRFEESVAGRIDEIRLSVSNIAESALGPVFTNSVGSIIADRIGSVYADPDDDPGRFIAGYGAVATAKGSVQIGPGTNSVQNTIQFRDKKLATENYVTEGFLPLHGGVATRTGIDGVSYELQGGVTDPVSPYSAGHGASLVLGGGGDTGVAYGSTGPRGGMISVGGGGGYGDFGGGDGATLTLGGGGGAEDGGGRGARIVLNGGGDAYSRSGNGASIVLGGAGASGSDEYGDPASVDIESHDGTRLRITHTGDVNEDLTQRILRDTAGKLDDPGSGTEGQFLVKTADAAEWRSFTPSDPVDYDKVADSATNALMGVRMNGELLVPDSNHVVDVNIDVVLPDKWATGALTNSAGLSLVDLSVSAPFSFLGSDSGSEFRFITPVSSGFIAGGSTGIWKSSDGISWEAVSEFGGVWNSAIEYGDRMIAVGNSGIAASTDGGSSWSVVHAGRYRSICVGGSFMVAGGENTGNYVMSSTDGGETWVVADETLAGRVVFFPKTGRFLSFSAAGSRYSGPYAPVGGWSDATGLPVGVGAPTGVYAGLQYAVIGTSSKGAWYTEDGMEWHQVPVSVAPEGKQIFVTGDSSSGRIVIGSADGVWTVRGSSPGGNGWAKTYSDRCYGLGFAGGLYTMTGESADSVFVSTDAVAWLGTTFDPEHVPVMSGVVFSGMTFVAPSDGSEGVAYARLSGPLDPDRLSKVPLVQGVSVAGTLVVPSAGNVVDISDGVSSFVDGKLSDYVKNGDNVTFSSVTVSSGAGKSVAVWPDNVTVSGGSVNLSSSSVDVGSGSHVLLRSVDQLRFGDTFALSTSISNYIDDVTSDFCTAADVAGISSNTVMSVFTNPASDVAMELDRIRIAATSSVTRVYSEDGSSRISGDRTFQTHHEGETVDNLTWMSSVVAGVTNVFEIVEPGVRWRDPASGLGLRLADDGSGSTFMFVMNGDNPIGKSSSPVTTDSESFFLLPFGDVSRTFLDWTTDGRLASETYVDASVSGKLDAPAGGTAGQVLTKTADAVAWMDPVSGGGGLTTNDVVNIVSSGDGGMDIAVSNAVDRILAVPSDVFRDAVAVSGIGAARPLPKYLYALDFNDSYTNDAAWYYAQPQDYGQCSAMCDGGFLYRNYDWKFDNAAEFVVRMTAGSGRFASIGVANVGTNLTEQFVTSGKPSRYYKCLPGRTVDGINENGVVCEVNVVDGEPPASTGGDIHPLAAVRWALDNGTSAAMVASNLASRIAFPAGWTQNFHWMIADDRETWIVENGTAQIVLNLSHPTAVMTNFRLYPTHSDGPGQERYYMLQQGGANITNVWYTNAYSPTADWASEFKNVDEQNAATNAWANLGTMEARRATGAFWQTVHTSIYDITNKVLCIAVQERDDWYTFSVPSADGVKPDTVREIVRPMISAVIDATNTTFSSAVLAVGINTNELAAVHAFYEAFADIPISPEGGGITLLGIIGSIAAALVWLRKNKLSDSTADYDATAAYAVGAFAKYNGVLYVCNTAIPSDGEAWNPAHWTAMEDVTTLFSSANTSLVEVCKKHGGTQIKQDEDGNFYYEVETEEA